MNQNILQLCLSPDLGGLELYVQRITSFLQNNTNVTAIINEKGKLKTAFEKENLEYRAIKRNSKLLSFLSAKKIAHIIDERNIDVIHIHWTKDLHIAVLAKLFSKRKPKLVQTRHMHMTRFKSDFYHKFLYKNVDLMIAVTKLVQTQIEKFIPSDIRPKVITSYIGAKQPNIIDEKTKQTLKEEYEIQDKFTIGIVGRIEEPKGQYLVIEAVEELKNENIDTQALIIGHAMDNEYLEKLNQQIKQKGIRDNIIFTGFTSKVQKLMQICDVIVLATKKETFGLVLIEAMQCNTAVIGSNSGGPLEIIENKESGLLFETQDSKDLAQKIKYLYKNKKKKEFLAQKGQERAKELFNEYKQFEEVLKALF